MIRTGSRGILRSLHALQGCNGAGGHRRRPLTQGNIEAKPYQLRPNAGGVKSRGVV